MGLVKLLIRLWNTQKVLCIVWAGVIIYTVSFSIISFLRYDAFSYSDFDFGIFTHECWKILHGSAEISIFNNTPIWGNAMELISIVTSPVFFIFNFNPKSLLFLQSLFLAMGAVPIFLIARRKLPEQLAASLAFSYLFYPAIWYANLYEYNPLIYSTFTLLMSFYFFEEKRFKVFMLFIVLSLMNRADLSIVVLMFGVYAILSKRSWRWVLAPSLLSVLWVVLGLLVIIPKFKGSLSYDSSYPQFGHGFSEIIKNIILHPEILWRSLATHENKDYLLQILYPVGFFPLLALREFLICILSLLQHLISMRFEEHTILFHYTSTITPFIYISTIYGMARLVVNRRATLLMCALPVLLSFLANGTYGPISHSHQYLEQMHRNDEDKYKKKMLRRIPADAGVVSTFEFSPMLAGRYYFYSFHYIYDGFFSAKVPYKTPDNIDYAMINFNDSRLLSFYGQDSDANMRKFFGDYHFGVVDMLNSVVLFKKGFQGPLKLYEIRHPMDNHGSSVPVLHFRDQIKLTSFDVYKERKDDQPFLDFAFHWRAMTHVDKQLEALMVIVNGKGQKVYVKGRIICYGVYPTYRWSPQEEVVEYYDMLIPGYLAVGDYKVYMLLFPLGSKLSYNLNEIDKNTPVAFIHIPLKEKS